ncbi:DUF3152 domain-containing protein [Streptomyces rochei]|uniref:DUF3152 domain-containing protein n=1 Tax=Streptomyces rochei TaxID=1928 RepID=UPI00367B8BD1
MGRHSRRGPAPKPAGADTSARENRPGLLGRRRAPEPPAGDQAPPVSGAPGAASPGPQGGPWGAGGGGRRPGDVGLRGGGEQQGGGERQGYAGPRARPGEGAPAGTPAGTPAHGMPSVPGGTLPHGFSRSAEGTPAHGIPRVPDGTPARGFPRVPDGTAGRGVPGGPDGASRQGFTRGADGTPAHGVPGPHGGTPAHGVPRVRGGHPEQREAGGGWGELNGRTGAGYGTPAAPPAGAPAHPGPPGRPTGPGGPFPRQRQAPSDGARESAGPASRGGARQAPHGGPRQDYGGPRQDYLDAFDGDDDLFVPRPRPRTGASARPADPHASVTDWSTVDGHGVGGPPTGPGPGPDTDDAGPTGDPTGDPAAAKGGKGRTFTGIAAAAVTTVLAVVVAGQVADGSDAGNTRSQAAADQARGPHDPPSRNDDRPTPSASRSAQPLTYEQKMGKIYPLGATLKGSGKFEAIAGIADGPEKGERYTYRVEVERGLGLDGELFAEAVHKTLNDDRSWAHNGARSFSRIHSGDPDFVITLASPGTTAEWCAKSGLDTTVDNVSCDSAATQRVMINAYRWAQGAEPYGDDIHGYRQMLINHEVGHRIGYNHVTCDKDGELAPVMQQQTKFVDHDGIDCRPNPWAYPNS